MRQISRPGVLAILALIMLGGAARAQSIFPEQVITSKANSAVADTRGPTVEIFPTAALPITLEPTKAAEAEPADPAIAGLTTQSLPAPRPAMTVQPTTAAAVRPALVIGTPQESRKKIIDSSFVLFYSAAAVATVLDVESTVSGLRAGSQLREVNPIFGSRPSRGRMYGITMPLLVGDMFLGRWLKKKDPGSRRWMLVPSAMIVGHGVAAGINFSTR